MLCQISKDLLIQQNDCYTNYHIVTLTIPKRGMCWFNTSYKVLINKPFVGLTNPFLQCMLVISESQSATKEHFTHKLFFFLRPIQNSHSLLCYFRGIFIKFRVTHKCESICGSLSSLVTERRVATLANAACSTNY